MRFNRHTVLNDLVSPEPRSQTEAVKSAKNTPTTPIIEEEK